MRRRLRSTPPFLALLSLSLLIPLACGDSPTGGEDPDPPAALTEVSGSGQVGVVGVALDAPLVVEVTDVSGAPVGGAAVSWAVTAGGGSLSATSATTGTNGRASVTWTLGTTAGANAARATVTGLPAAVFTATGTPDRPAVVDVSPATATLTAAGDTVRLTADVADRHGNGIEEPEVVWSSSDTAVAVVAADGLVTARQSGDATITALADTARGTATVTLAAQPAGITVSPTADTINALYGVVTLTAEVTDGAGAPIPDAEVAWTSLDEAVATVHPDSGTVVARAPGVVAVVGAAGAVADTAAILVRQIPADLAVYPAADTTRVDHRIALHLVAWDSGGSPITEPSAAWTTSDATVAVVDAGGLVRGVAAGTATIGAAAGTGAAGMELLVLDNTITAGDTVAGTLATTGERGVFRFAGEAGQEVVVFFGSSPGDVPLSLTLFEAYGTPAQRALGSVYVGQQNGTDRWIGRVELPDDGTYTLVVDADYVLNPEAYTVEVYRIDRAPESRPATFAIGDTVTGEEIDRLGDIDMFTFEGTADQQLTVFFQPLDGAGELQLRVYQGPDDLGDSNWRAWLDTPPVDDLDTVGYPFTLAAAGTHTVVVEGSGTDDVGPYRFELYAIDRAPESVAATLAVGDTIAGEAMDRLGDIDTFYFDPEGRATELLFQPMGEGAGQTRVVVQRDDGGAPLVEATLDAGVAESLDAHSTGALPPIPLRITIGENRGWTGPYRMLVRFID